MSDRSEARCEPATSHQLEHPRSGLRAAAQRARIQAKAMSSMLSVPHRNAAWGNAGYRGNCDGTLIKNLILRYDGVRSIADPMEGSGTTRDVVAWLNDQLGLGLTYWGADLRTGFNLLKRPLPGKYDLVWLHPPYWDIIRYSDHAADLSTSADYTLFLTRLRRCLARCAEAVAPGGRLAVLVGDVRRNGRYYCLTRDVMNMAGDLGELSAVIIKAQHNVRSNTKHYSGLVEPRIQHETCVVFRRPLLRGRGMTGAG